MSANMQINTMIGVRPVETGAVGQAGTAMMKAVAGYQPGDKLSAQVVSVDGQNVNLQLPDGTEVTTQFPDGVPANVGDTVDLMLVNKQPGNVQFRLDAINGQSVHLDASQMDGYLMDRGIPATQINEAAAQVFMRNGTTPTPRNISNLIDIAAKLPDIPTSVAVTMAENNVPPTRENADILIKWSSGPATLGGDVSALEGLVSQQSGVSEFANTLQNNLAQTTPRSLAQVITQSPGFEQLTQQLAAMTGQEMHEPAQAIQNFVSSLDLPPQEQQAAQQALTDAFVATAQQAGDPVQTSGTAPQTAEPAQNAPAPQQAAPAAVPEQPVAAQTEAQPAGAAAASAVAEQTGAAVHTEETSAAGGHAAQAAVEPDTVQQQDTAAKPESGGPGRASAEEQSTREAGHTPVPRDSDSPETAIRKEGSQILSNLQKFIVRARGEHGTGPTDGQAIQESVRSQQELANLTKASVSRLFGQNSPAAGRASDLSNEVRLGNQMDQFYYAQIPFQTPQQNGTADLYVFKRNPQKAEAERTHITVLIGLDTQHMGRVESVLRSAEGRLSVEFRVASSAVQRYFEESVRQFSDEMKESGFELDGVRVTQIKEKVTPLNAMKVMEPKETIRLRGLDIEA